MFVIRLLFISKDRSQFLERSTHYLIEELKKKIHVTVWTDHGHLPTIVSSLSYRPDFIVLNDFKPDYCPFISDIKEVDIPVGIIMHDLQYKLKQRKRWIEKENIRHIFSHYRDPFLRWFPEYTDRFIWFPHHVPIGIFKDYQQQKTIDWLFVGASFPQMYPLRNRIITLMKKKPGFVIHPHPGYDAMDVCDEQVFVGERYAREINRAKMLLTCQSIYRFPVLKYFEGAACNTLVMADGSKELEDLGFIDGDTFVEIDEENLLEKATYYLHHETERMEIAARGYDMVRKHHSTEKRADQFINYIRNILTNHQNNRCNEVKTK